MYFAGKGKRWYRMQALHHESVRRVEVKLDGLIILAILVIGSSIKCHFHASAAVISSAECRRRVVNILAPYSRDSGFMTHSG